MTTQAPASVNQKHFRILIASCPKTGNNWIKCLLAYIYQVPGVTVGWEGDMRDPSKIDLPAQDCIGHEHLSPGAGLLRMVRAEDIRVVTMLRHPADVFVSLYHYVNKRPESYREHPWHSLLVGKALDDDQVYQFLDKCFHHFCMEVSLQWLESGAAIPVRYEDLRADPKKTLTELTGKIAPAAEDRIDGAIDHCRLDRMRNFNDKLKLLCRKGQVNEWASALSDRQKDIMRRHEDLMQRMGYSLRPTGG